MTLSDKPLSAITKQDLLDLIENKVGEGKEYDYKVKLPDNSDPSKKEFLADVSSFANTIGGHLIFGIDEDGLLPIAIPGLPDIDADKEILRLENMLRDGIAPRISGINIRSISLDTSIAIIVRIPRSWAGPHMVTFQNMSRFYARNSAGKYPLDVYEIRRAFTLSETTTQTIRGFRTDRLIKIMSGEMPVELAMTAKLVLHIIPLRAFDPAVRYNVAALTQKDDDLPLRHLESQAGFNCRRHNFDGLLAYRQSDSRKPAQSYFQIFSSGIAEYVDTQLLSPEHRPKLVIPTGYESEINKLLPHIFTIQKQLGVDAPLLIFLSLLGVRGYAMNVREDIAAQWNMSTIDRNDLIVPEIMVESYDEDCVQFMKQLYDPIWNACGFAESDNYEAGKWVGHANKHK